MDYYHLTTPQQNIWNLQKYYEDTAIANLCGVIIYNEKRSSALLQQAICQFVRSQSGIRLRFREAGEPKQYVCDEVDEAVPVLKFDSMEEFDRYAEAFAKEPLGLNERQMYRFVVVQIGEKSGILVVLSHMIADAWTFGLMANEVDAAYHKLAEGEDGALAGADYVAYIQSESEYLTSNRYVKDKSFWEEKYTDRPEESTIKVCPVPAASIKAKRITRTLPLALEDKIEVFCKTHPVTPAVLFETALIVYLAKVNAENQTITIGVPVLNRSNAREKTIAGMFISTMPLTVAVTENVTVTELASEITRGHMELFRHQKYPYADILRYLREKQNFSGNLYDAMISYQNAKTDTGATTKWYSNGYSEVPFVMHIDNRDRGNSHRINVDYQVEVFKDEAEVEALIDRLEHILEQITEDSEKKVNDICIVPEPERKKVIEEFNDTYVDYPREKCVQELFVEQAERTPEKVAVVFQEREITYRELDEMSNILAHLLREKGIGRGDIVPIIAKRNWHILAAMLGILKAGAGYMPVSPDYPKERVQFMVKEAGSKVGCVFGYEEQLEGIEFVNLDEIDFDGAEPEKKLPMKNQNSSEDICYVIYTSGSTGVPKGVVVTHRNVVNYSNYSIQNTVCSRIIKEEYRKIISVTNIVFDIFVTESILPLLNGITVYMTGDDEVYNQGKINRIITDNAIDVLQTTPTKLKGYLLDKTQKEYLSTLKVIILGGEALSVGLYEQLRKETTANIFNIYGPAETTVWSSNAEVMDGNITIGTSIANTQIYILDKQNNPVPIGVPGELCIAGEGVGLGYLNRPELTAEKFVPNLFATKENHHGAVMYHTGDLARWRADGEIEYLGRMDTQVKIRGLRIELGEIESVMAGFPGIALCAVADKKDNEGRQYLVGYYTVTESKGEAVDEKMLREHLLSKLPNYMVPNYFMCLDAMPMTPSGKTDRKNLPVPEFTFSAREYVAPTTEPEKELCHLLEDLLQMERVGITDDFFELGGDSLAAIEYMAKAHSRGVEFALQNVYDYRTVQSLCEFLEKGTESRVEYVASDFEKYQELFAENVIDEAFEPKKRSLGNVLLTGATGFLGAHVLAQLVKEEDGTIYCLVRSGEKEDRRGRLRELLQYYFGNQFDEEIGKRIIPVVGDIEQENLAEQLPTDVQTVIHTAASVKHYGSYEYFHHVNVEGTRHVIDYAKSVGAKMIHISTLSVSGNSLADNFNVYRSEEEKQFFETSLYIGQPLDNVYIHSKFEAEMAVYDAMLSGLDATVIRVGNLTNRASDFKFQPNFTENAFLTRVKAVLEFGLFPDYLMPLYAEFSPIDLTAEGIVKIAQYAEKQCVFHLNSNRPIYFDRFLEVVHDLGISMQVVDGTTFNQALQQTIKSVGTEYIFEAFQNDMDEQGRLVYDSNIRIRNEFTDWFLMKLGFEWNKIDMEYIRGYVEYFRELGYLKV